MPESRSRALLKKWWPVLTIALLIIVLDQITKLIITSTLVPGESWLSESPVQVTYVRNSGSAFGFFRNQTFPLIVASFIAIGFILYYFRNTVKPPAIVIIALGMQLGGALGNLIDRIRLGYVVDFIDFRFWPIFNAADSSISISLVMLAFYVLVIEKDSKKAKPQQTAPTPSADFPAPGHPIPEPEPTSEAAPPASEPPPVAPQPDKRPE